MAIGDVPDARVIPALKQAWTNIWPHFWWLLLFQVLSVLTGGLTTGSDEFDPVLLAIDIASALVAIFVGFPLSIGLVKAHLTASRGEKPTWHDFGHGFQKRYWASIGLGLLSALIVIGGLLLLIIPGIYLAVKLTFAAQRLVEDDLSVTDAIRASFHDVKGRWWPVFGFVLLSILIVVAGILALVVGVLVAMVLVSQWTAVYWRAIRAEQDRRHLDREPQAPSLP